jgi:signal transduction histidine kinase
MRSATDNLLVIIIVILDFAKLEFDRLAIQGSRHVPAALVESISAGPSFRARPEKRIVFRCTVGISCPEGSCRFQQAEAVLRYLVSNALQFTTNGGMTVSVIPLFEDGGNRYICQDAKTRGIGVPKIKLAAIFESFEQEDRSFAGDTEARGAAFDIRSSSTWSGGKSG